MPRRPLSTTATGRVIYPLRIGRTRRVVAWVTLLGLVGVMGGYWYLTDSRRVKSLAQAYLQRILKAPVTIKSAELSLFRGLKLRGIEVLSPDAGVGGGVSGSGVLFTATAFDVRFDLFSLIRGDLSAGNILAIDPHLRLVSDEDRRTWNFQSRMDRGPSSAPATATSQEAGAAVAAARAESLGLPEMILRNGRVDYGEVSGGVYRPIGSALVNGKLLPAGNGRYAFELQARGNPAGATNPTEADALGPTISGQINLKQGSISGQLKNFELSPDVRTMLPLAVRNWWERHELAGRIDVPEFMFVPGRPGSRMSFRLVTSLKGAQLAVHPDELRSTAENQNLELWHRFAKSAGTLGGRLRGKGGLSGRLGDDSGRFVDERSFAVRDITGTFTFTERGVAFDGRGQIDNNRITISGSTGGYAPESPFRAVLASDAAQPLELTTSPGFVPILPPEVREVYDRFAPSGQGSFRFELVRAEPGGRPVIDGKLSIEDGRFTFLEMPYPLHGGRGEIAIRPDPRGGTRLDILDVSGHGPLGSPNANAKVTVNGTMWPLEGGAAVDVLIKGENLTADPQLKTAFQPDVKEVLRQFDPVGDDVLPRFSGGFTSTVHRDLGPISKWTIDVDIDFHDGSGRFAGFPYPLEGLSGRVLVRRDHVLMQNIRMSRLSMTGGTGGAEGKMALDGKISWKRPPPGAPKPATEEPRQLVYAMDIRATGVPLNGDLIGALPPDAQAGVHWLGATGSVDVAGTVSGTAPDLKFDIALRNATLTPDAAGASPDQQWTLAGVEARLGIVDHRLKIESLTGTHGDSRYNISGEVFPSGPSPAGTAPTRAVTAGSFDPPPMRLNIDATNLAFEPSLRHILPAAAQMAWDETLPQGTADLTVNYAFDRPLEMRVVPRGLSVQPRALPLRWYDLGGEVSVHGSEVRLAGVTGHRPPPLPTTPSTTPPLTAAAPSTASTRPARLKVDGKGNLDKPSRWQLDLTVSDLPLTAEVRAALPEMLKTTIDSTGLGGVIDLRMPDLQIAANPTPANPDALDLSFALGMALREGRLDLQVPVTQAIGGLTAAGVVRQGRLASLDGDLTLQSANVAGRTMMGVTARFRRPSDLPGLVVEDIRGRMADGDIDGSLVLALPETGPTRYTLNILLRDADAAIVSGLTDSGMVGRFSGSLGLEGTVGVPASLRGRGDVRVSGQSLVKIPLVLGFVQVANLTLPDSTPFNEATMRYIVEGRKIRIETLSLTSPALQMKGSGVIDLGAGKVMITLTPSSTGGFSVPVLSDLIDPARRELLTIVIRGSVSNPKVSASSFGTVTTTIDQITRPNQGDR